MTIAVVQLGARMHYAVPRILAAAGLLDRFYTDATGDTGWPRGLALIPQRLQPKPLRNLLARRPRAVVPRARIVSYPSLGFRAALDLRRAAGDPARTAAAHLATGRRLAACVLRTGLGGAAAVYAFNSAARDVFREAKRRGLTTVYEQTIAPVRVERDLIDEEYRRWPGWEHGTVSDEFYRPFAAVEDEEWGLSDVIVCGSEFVREGFRAAGGPVDRCTVVAYGVDLPPAGLAARAPLGGRPLRVLTVGTVGLRKGAPYVAAAAEAMKGAAEFRWVGPVNLAAAGKAALSRSVHLTGAVPRSEMASHYGWADVFLLPSICEGSATVTYEALGHGLPVVVTPNTGAPLRGGPAGDVVPIRDPGAVVARLRAYLEDPERWRPAHEAALAAAGRLSVAAYGERLLAALPEHLRTR